MFLMKRILLLQGFMDEVYQLRAEVPLVDTSFADENVSDASDLG